MPSRPVPSTFARYLIACEPTSALGAPRGSAWNYLGDSPVVWHVNLTYFDTAGQPLLTIITVPNGLTHADAGPTSERDARNWALTELTTMTDSTLDRDAWHPTGIELDSTGTSGRLLRTPDGAWALSADLGTVSFGVAACARVPEQRYVRLPRDDWPEFLLG